MITPEYFSVCILTFLGLGLAIPSNTCIVVVYLESFRKKEKMSPSDVILLAKGLVNVLLQSLLTVQGSLFVYFRAVFYRRDVYACVNAFCYFLIFCGFWLTAWLSVYYYTSITKLSYKFLWLRRIVSNFLSQVLFLTVLGLFVINVVVIWTLPGENPVQASEKITNETHITRKNVPNYYVAPVTFLGCVLPFCISLLCLVLTSSFLVRHVWRVKNNDSGSTHPNLQAHVTAMRTIVFLLLIFMFFAASHVIFVVGKHRNSKNLAEVSWTYRFLSPSLEAAIIFQASNKLKKIILRRFWTRN